MIKQLINYFLAFGLFPIWIGAQEAPLQGKANNIEEIIKTHVQNHQFSGTVLVANNGNPIVHQSQGLGYRLTPDTLRNHYHYAIASVTKLFTAIRILQLVGDQQLQLNQPVVQHLPQYTDRISDEITIHHLLLHLSGLPNEKDRVYRHPLDPNDLVALTLKNKTKAKFGTFNYNNLDYVLLGLVIEAITENTWQQEIQTHLLDALQMSNTGFLAYGPIPQRFCLYLYLWQTSPTHSRSFLLYRKFLRRRGHVFQCLRFA